MADLPPVFVMTDFDDDSGWMPSQRPRVAVDSIPVFVITGFDDDNVESHDRLLQPLLEWAIRVSRDGRARVFFVTNCASFLHKERINRVDWLRPNDVDTATALQVRGIRATHALS